MPYSAGASAPRAGATTSVMRRPNSSSITTGQAGGARRRNGLRGLMDDRLGADAMGELAGEILARGLLGTLAERSRPLEAEVDGRSPHGPVIARRRSSLRHSTPVRPATLVLQVPGLRAQLEAAIAEAATTRGIVALSGSGRRAPWASAHGATDGRLEVRVAQPRRRWGLGDDPAGELVLGRLGFVPRVDAWSAPVPDARRGAELLEAALRDAFGVADPLPRVERWPGPSAQPGPRAPVRDHVEATLGVLTRGGAGKACLEAGRPAATWAWAWVVDGDLVITPEPEDPAVDPPELRAPLAPGVELGAARRLVEEYPPPPGEPLFVQLID